MAFACIVIELSAVSGWNPVCICIIDSNAFSDHGEGMLSLIFFRIDNMERRSPRRGDKLAFLPDGGLLFLDINYHVIN